MVVKCCPARIVKCWRIWYFVFSYSKYLKRGSFGGVILGFSREIVKCYLMWEKLCSFEDVYFVSFCSVACEVMVSGASPFDMHIVPCCLGCSRWWYPVVVTGSPGSSVHFLMPITGASQESGSLRSCILGLPVSPFHLARLAAEVIPSQSTVVVNLDPLPFLAVPPQPDCASHSGPVLTHHPFLSEWCELCSPHYSVWSADLCHTFRMWKEMSPRKQEDNSAVTNST